MPRLILCEITKAEAPLVWNPFAIAQHHKIFGSNEQPYGE